MQKHPVTVYLLFFCLCICWHQC